jgi:uncharacterized protein YndB with AHSA1/START domain
MRIQKSIEIRAVAEKIWPLLSEPANIAKWCSPAKKMRRTNEQRTGLGTTFYFEERAVGRLMKLNFIVTEWFENRSVAYKMTSGNLVKGYEQRYTLETTKTGIRVTCLEKVKLPFGILGKCFELFRRPFSAGHLVRMLAELKVMSECA